MKENVYVLTNDREYAMDALRSMLGTPSVSSGKPAQAKQAAPKQEQEQEHVPAREGKSTGWHAIAKQHGYIDGEGRKVFRERVGIPAGVKIEDFFAGTPKQEDKPKTRKPRAKKSPKHVVDFTYRRHHYHGEAPQSEYHALVAAWTKKDGNSISNLPKSLKDKYTAK